MELSIQFLANLTTQVFPAVLRQRRSTNRFLHALSHRKYLTNQLVPAIGIHCRQLTNQTLPDLWGAERGCLTNQRSPAVVCTQKHRTSQIVPALEGIQRCLTNLTKSEIL